MNEFDFELVWNGDGGNAVDYGDVDAVAAHPRVPQRDRHPRHRSQPTC